MRPKRIASFQCSALGKGNGRKSKAQDGFRLCFDFGQGVYDFFVWKALVCSASPRWPHMIERSSSGGVQSA